MKEDAISLPAIRTGRTFCLEIIRHNPRLKEGNLLGAMHVHKAIGNTFLYDSAGIRWELENVTPANNYGLLAWVVAQISNPRCQTILTWGKPCPYERGELEREIFNSLGKQGDILTQFMSTHEVEKAIHSAPSVEAIGTILEKSMFDGHPPPLLSTVAEPPRRIVSRGDLILITLMLGVIIVAIVAILKGI